MGQGIFDGESFDIKGSQGDPTGRLGLDFAVRDGLMVYGSVSTGYQAGFFQTQFDPDANESGPTEVKPEEITAFELGLKSVLPGNRGYFNIAAFSYDYQDMQVEIGGFGTHADPPDGFGTAPPGPSTIRRLGAVHRRPWNARGRT